MQVDEVCKSILSAAKTMAVRSTRESDGLAELQMSQAVLNLVKGWLMLRTSTAVLNFVKAAVETHVDVS